MKPLWVEEKKGLTTMELENDCSKPSKLPFPKSHTIRKFKKKPCVWSKSKNSCKIIKTDIFINFSI